MHKKNSNLLTTYLLTAVGGGFFVCIFSFHLEEKKCISKHMLDPKIERNSKCFFHIFADRLIDTKAD